MIDLNTTIKPTYRGGLVAEGDYTVTVDTIDAWTPHTKDIMVNKTDERGRMVKDATGKPVKELVKNYTFYTADVKLTVNGGDFDGATLYTSLTTHPNASFITENFARATKLIGVALKDIVTKAVDATLTVTVKHDTYDKVVTDPDTGLETVETKQKAKIIAFK